MFFFAAAFLAKLPEFDAEIIVAFVSNLILVTALLSVKANKYLIYTAFFGLILHIFGRVSYVAGYPDYLMLYNGSIFALNGIFVALLVGLSDDGLIGFNRVSNTAKNYLARMVGD